MCTLHKKLVRVPYGTKRKYLYTLHFIYCKLSIKMYHIKKRYGLTRQTYIPPMLDLNNYVATSVS